ncbi:SGNH/GDSL hydrolase family protein [Bowmanella sp. Y26]|uniref:SGNH/GDSL hydrolase family protein n=1 Tax=Bowmanella yangjiangensis TaxID=2811230 RepID=UPI001BDD37F6|nr:SGNH/GDSL hydrolase family protein [Bowmanella yangjiangensis]MBT1064121.1 SGNH/GDSL hydrolase family protein [Bowmanella yangjiangensis]
MQTLQRRPFKAAHSAFAMLLLLVSTYMPSQAAPAAQSWVTSWAASPQPTWKGDFALPIRVPPQLWDQTLRQVLHLSLGGQQLRLRISNQYGTQPLNIGATSAAITKDGATIHSAYPVHFGGQRDVTIPAGASAISDPISVAVDNNADITLSMYLPRPTSPDTFHWDGLQTAYIGSGNQVDSLDMQVDSTSTTRMFVSALYVQRNDSAKVVVAFGDSITDGNASSIGRNHRWPDFLASRLAAHNVAVVNAGISGARLLDSGMGENALARFEQDVLAQPGVSSVILMMGINDIGWPGSALAPDKPPVSAKQIITAYQQLISLAHLHQIRIIGATLTPFEGALQGTPMQGYYTAQKEQVRQQVNDWIRSAGEFDGVVDFDALTRDPQQPALFLPRFDSGDHLHPGDVGYQAMAEAVDIQTLLYGPTED